MSERTEIRAYCNNGHPVGIYKNVDEMTREVVYIMKRCPDPECNIKFKILPDGRIWDLHWDTVKVNNDDYSSNDKAAQGIAKNLVESFDNSKISQPPVIIIHGNNYGNVTSAINSKMDLRQDVTYQVDKFLEKIAEEDKLTRQQKNEIEIYLDSLKGEMSKKEPDKSKIRKISEALEKYSSLLPVLSEIGKKILGI